MRDPSDPPRQHYQLKPKEFESVNSSGENAPPSALPTDVQAHFRAAGATPLRSTPPPEAPNEVHAMLRDNLTRANAAGLNDLDPLPPKRSRRKRHYWLLTICTTLLFGTIAVITGPQMPVPFTCAIAGLGIVNFSVWWIMWHILDDY